MPNPVVSTVIPDIIKALCGMSDDCKRHFRIKTRIILDRLIRKYGCDIIQAHVPPNDTVMLKRLRNMRKINNRKKREKEQEENHEHEQSDEADNEFSAKKTKSTSIQDILADSDSDFYDDDNSATKNTSSSNKKKKGSTWIEEDADTIIDFTDPSVRAKITATNPTHSAVQLQAPKKKDRGFKTAPDGRLIIEDLGDDSEEDELPKKKSGNKMEFSDSDDEIASAAETLALSNRKRKRSDQSEASHKTTTGKSTTSTSKYQAGGSGIHRKLSRPGTSAAGSEYKSKKAAGDVKKKGKAEPYAYLPLKRADLNKRKKMKAAGQFKKIIKAAQAGALKGRKAK